MISFVFFKVEGDFFLFIKNKKFKMGKYLKKCERLDLKKYKKKKIKKGF